jgi:hypothetical protein
VLALTILVDGLTYASWLFIVAPGLTRVFGVLKILNDRRDGARAGRCSCRRWRCRTVW